MKTFREFVVQKEGMTLQGIVNPDKKVDDEITNNPNLLLPQGVNPQKIKPLITQAIQKKKINPNASLDAIFKATKISNDRLTPPKI